jgi:hypothetical protein
MARLAVRGVKNPPNITVPESVILKDLCCRSLLFKKKFSKDENGITEKGKKPDPAV